MGPPISHQSLCTVHAATDRRMLQVVRVCAVTCASVGPTCVTAAAKQSSAGCPSTVTLKNCQMAVLASLSMMVVVPVRDSCQRWRCSCLITKDCASGVGALPLAYDGCRSGTSTAVLYYHRYHRA
jgi:hypothetical protein